MIKLFTLGDIYISDFIKEGEEPRGGKHNLQLVMDEDTRAVRLETAAPLNQMFGKYFYRSGINEVMRKELKNIVDSILPLMKFKENDIFCDCACNDGTLLSFVPKSFIRVGIDPADDSFKKESEQHADLIIQDFFSESVFKNSKFGNQKIKILTAIAVFYDLENPDAFLQDVYKVLDDDGLFVMQLSHSGLMIEQCAFDNILSEHIFYYTLNSLMPYLKRNGFSIVDCSLNDTNGGSFRVYIRKNIANVNLFATQPFRDVCNYRINSLISYEKELGLDLPETWMNFYRNINLLKTQVVSFIKHAKSEGKSIWAYSASTKGNTFLQYCGLDNSLIDGIAERSVFKWGLKTVGTNIPIYSEDEFRKSKANFCLVLAWHFIGNFVEREKDYLDGGGKFIVPLPKFTIIEK